MTMKLYYHPLSTFSQKTLMGLHEKGAEFSPQIVNIADPEARAAYQKINPFCRLPTLELDDGYRVPESAVILEWADVHVKGGTKLLPDGADEARRTRFHERLADLYLAAPFQTIFFDSRKPPEERNPKAVEAAQQTIQTMLSILDKHLEKRTWVLGDTFTLADCAHAPTLSYLRMTAPNDALKNVNAYASRLFERASWQKVMAEAQPYFAQMMKK